MRQVALLRAASTEADQPRHAFVAALRARLEQELRHLPTTPRAPFPDSKPSHLAQDMRHSISRRALVRGGATAAASLLVGAGLGATMERLAPPPVSGPGATTHRWSPPLVPAGEGRWVAVAKLVDLGEDAQRFATATIVGYLIRGDGRDGESPVSSRFQRPARTWAASCSGTMRIGSTIAPVTAASSPNTATRIKPGLICPHCPAWKRELPDMPPASSSRSGCRRAHPPHEVRSLRPRAR